MRAEALADALLDLAVQSDAADALVKRLIAAPGEIFGKTRLITKEV